MNGPEDARTFDDEIGEGYPIQFGGAGFGGGRQTVRIELPRHPKVGGDEDLAITMEVDRNGPNSDAVISFEGGVYTAEEYNAVIGLIEKLF